MYLNKNIISKEPELNILDAAYENRYLTQHQIARKISLQIVLKKHHCHGCHMKINQNLHVLGFQNCT